MVQKYRVAETVVVLVVVAIAAKVVAIIEGEVVGRGGKNRGKERE